jgi:hypothetical protein
MKSKGLLTASFLLLVLAGIIWWSNKKAATADKMPVEKTTTKLLSIPEDQIQLIEIKKRAGETVHLQRNDSKWEIAAAKPLRADPEAVSSMLSTLSSLSSDRTIDEKATSLGQYGLTQPAIELSITDKNKKNTSLLIGDDTPAGTAVYAAIAGDPRVFALSSYKKNSFDKSTNDLRDKRLVPFDSDKVTRIELQSKKQTIEFARDKNQWQIVRPSALRADQSAVEELLRNLRDAKMDLNAADDEKKIAAAFNSAAPLATARVTDASGAQELLVRKSKDDFFAKSTAVEGIHKVPGSVATSLEKNLDDFRTKKLFDFGFADPDKVEFHDGSKSYFLTRSGSDWWTNGTKLDPGTVSPLVDRIRDFAANKFAESGFGGSSMELTVTSDGGKRVEKVILSKSGDKYLAKRENEPALYEVNASSVTELQKSVADLKPAPPPSKK